MVWRILFLWLIAIWCTRTDARAQQPVFGAASIADEVLDMSRPRIAVASDGSKAIAVEMLVRDGSLSAWEIAVQRFSPAGNPVGPIHRFTPEILCGSFDSWTDDHQTHAEIQFRSDGVLVVLMLHYGWFEFAGDGVRSSEITIGAVGADGQRIDLDPEWDRCTQEKLIFVGAGLLGRPRMDILPDNAMLITAVGFFQDSDLRNVAVRALDAGLGELIEEVIPHDDPLSKAAFHMYPDVATNGDLILSTWHECPIIDGQGNANDCDIGAQFARVTQAGLAVVGGNQRVNVGDTFGTLNLYPSAAMNASGSSVVVWADARTGPQGDIFAQRFDAQGQAVGSNIRVSDGSGVINTRPEVAILNDGAFMVMWMDSTAGSYRARGRRFDAAGNAVSAPFFVTTQAGVQTGEPHVASNGSDFAYVWSTLRNGSSGVVTNDLGRVVAREEIPTPAALALEIYPNPIGTQATVRYELPESGRVTISLLDMLGREVTLIEDGVRPGGVNEVRLDVAEIAAGTYMLHLRTAAETRSLPVVKLR